MDNRLNQMNMRRPRGIVGSPYQVLPPIYPVPPVAPLIPPGPMPPPPPPGPTPPPPQNVNIIVNKEDENQGVTDYKQDQSISVISSRLDIIEAALAEAGITSLELGILSTQAYRGSEGQFNREWLTRLNADVSNLNTNVNTLADDVSNAVKPDDLVGYATVSGMTENIDALRGEIPTTLSQFSDYDNLVTDDELSGLSDTVSTISTTYASKTEVTGIIDNVLSTSETLSTVVSAVVSVMQIQTPAEEADYSELYGSISFLNNNI